LPYSAEKALPPKSKRQSRIGKHDRVAIRFNESPERNVVVDG
jgi:hypothetical protein